MTAAPGLFGDDLPEVIAVEKLSPDRRRTLRQKDDVKHGRHPLTGLRLLAPDDVTVTCGTCIHRFVFDGNLAGLHGGKYPKCEAFGITNGAGSDCRAWWPGCEMWQAKP